MENFTYIATYNNGQTGYVFFNLYEWFKCSLAVDIIVACSVLCPVITDKIDKCIYSIKCVMC